MGIRYTLKALEVANDLEAMAVVLHLGKVPIKTDVRELFTLFDSGRIKESEGNELIQRIKQEREAKRQGPLDHVLSCLDKLQREAERLGVFLGIENRYFPDEIPDFEEVGIILKEFRGSKIRYWHDVGHAKVQEITEIPISDLNINESIKEVLALIRQKLFENIDIKLNFSNKLPVMMANSGLIKLVVMNLCLNVM